MCNTRDVIEIVLIDWVAEWVVVVISFDGAFGFNSFTVKRVSACGNSG